MVDLNVLKICQISSSAQGNSQNLDNFLKVKIDKKHIRKQKVV